MMTTAGCWERRPRPFHRGTDSDTNRGPTNLFSRVAEEGCAHTGNATSANRPPTSGSAPSSSSSRGSALRFEVLAGFGVPNPERRPAFARRQNPPRTLPRPPTNTLGRALSPRQCSKFHHVVALLRYTAVAESSIREAAASLTSSCEAGRCCQPCKKPAGDRTTAKAELVRRLSALLTHAGARTNDSNLP